MLGAPRTSERALNSDRRVQSGVLSRLDRLPARARVALLAEALAHSGADEASPIVLRLLELCSTSSSAEAAGSLGLLRFARFLHVWLPEVEPVEPQALRALARSWKTIPADLRELVAAAGRGRWRDSLRTLATSPTNSERQIVAALCAEAADSSLAVLAGELLGDPDPGVRAAAGDALERLALAAAAPEDASWLGDLSVSVHEGAFRIRAAWGPEDRCAVADAVAHAARGLSAHKQEVVQEIVLRAVLLLAGSALPRESSLWRWIHDRESSSHATLRGFIRRDRSALSRLRAVEWLAQPAVAGACADRLLAASTMDEHESVLSRWPLLLRPARAARLARVVDVRQSASVTRAEQALPDPDRRDRLSVDARLGLIRLAQSLGLPPANLDRHLEPALVDGEPRVRLAASRAASSRLLPDFVFDPSEAVSRSAFLRLSCAGVSGAARAPGAERQIERRAGVRPLLRAPVSVIRSMASDELDVLCDLSRHSPLSRVHLRRAMRLDPAWVLSRLREMLRQSGEGQSLAVMLARRLSVLPDLEGDVFELVRRGLASAGIESITRGVATATSALGDLPGAEAATLLGEATEAADQRVRANAVDALVHRVRTGIDARPEQVIDRLHALRSDAWHRVRGSALRGLAQIGRPAAPGQRPGDAAVALDGESIGRAVLEMLEDSRPMHRLAASWVAQRTFPGGELRELKLWPSLASRLRSLSISEPDPRVRARARLTLQRAGEGAPVMESTFVVEHAS